MENVNLGRKIYKEFTKAFEKLETVDEIGIIPFSAETNKSPIHVEGSCIGVEQWAVKLLYMNAYNEWMAGSEDKVLEQTRCIVLFCGDCVTAWNSRKKILSLKPTSDWVRNELETTKLAIRIQPKSSDSFAHRRWILKVLSNSKSTEEMKEFVKKEFIFCKKAADWHPCNYNAWSHRVWVFNEFISKPLFSEDKHYDCLKLLKCEFESVLSWMEVNVSDHCCMSYLLHILNTLNRSTNAEDSFVGNLWEKTLLNCTQLVLLHGSNHEALWYFRKGIFFNFYKSSKLKSDKKMLSLFSYQKEIQFCEKLKKSFFLDKYLKFLEKFVFPIIMK